MIWHIWFDRGRKTKLVNIYMKIVTQITLQYTYKNIQLANHPKQSNNQLKHFGQLASSICDAQYLKTEILNTMGCYCHFYLLHLLQTVRSLVSSFILGIKVLSCETSYSSINAIPYLRWTYVIIVCMVFNHELFVSTVTSPNEKVSASPNSPLSRSLSKESVHQENWNH